MVFGIIQHKDISMTNKAKFYILLNPKHKLLQTQTQQIENSNHEIVHLPEKLKQIWGVIPPDEPSITRYLEPIIQYLVQVLHPGDTVWVQGHMGATYIMVNKIKDQGAKPVYASMKKLDSIDTNISDSAVSKGATLEHVRFIEYGV